MSDEERIEQLELEVKVLRANNKGLKDKIDEQSKEIEELKEDRKKYAEEYIHNNPWLYKQLDENYILRTEADKLYNKKWEDKIKAKIEEIEEILNGQLIEKLRVYFEAQKEVLESLLEKE